MRPNSLSGIPLACAISLALGIDPASAATITVTDGGDAGTPATCTLRQAIVSANTDAAGASTCTAGSGPDTIAFAANLVNATISLAGTQLEATAPLTIYGSGQTIDAGKQSRVLYVNGTSLDASNVTLTHGSAAGGGAILATAATVALERVTITKNYAIGAAGGGITVDGGSISITNTIVSNNTADSNGGGVLVSNAVLTMTNTLVSNNAGSRSGGVVFLSPVSGSASIRQSTISGNTAACTASACAAGLFAAGGSASSGPIDIVDSTISGNTAAGATFTYVAGGAYLFDIAATLTNSTIAGNAASGSNYVVGGVWEEHVSANSGHGLTLTNCTVSANQVTAGSPTVTGGILVGALVDAGYTSSLTLANTIASANSSGDVQSGVGSANVGASYSLLGTALAIPPYNDGGSHNVFSDTPQLTPLQANGGPTQTLAPMTGSPAIDVGSNALATYDGTALLYDQRGGGYPRISNGKVDIGAVENAGDLLFVDGFDPGP